MGCLRVFLALIPPVLLAGACDTPPAPDRKPAASAPSRLEDPPYAPDSVFKPETHRPDPVLPATALSTLATIRAADASPFSYFGQAVALDGDVAVVGAPYDDGAGPIDAGAAYVFQRRGDRWEQAARLTAPRPRAYDRFGFSVAAGGGTIVVGADRADHGGGVDTGAAFVFRADGRGGWRLDAALEPRDLAEKDGLGISVAADGDSVLVGAPGKDGALSGEGAAYLFRHAGGSWREKAKLTDPAPAEHGGFGYAVALSRGRALVGAFASNDLQVLGGRAYLFRRGERGWDLEAKLAAREPKPLERFGSAVALKGDLAIVGAPRAALGEKTRAGTVSLFHRTDEGWSLVSELTAPVPRSDEEFGRALSLGESSVVVGSQFGDAAGLSTGVSYLFRREGDRWIGRGPLLAGEVRPLAEFGYAVALSEPWILIGAPREDQAGNAAGCAYLYNLSSAPEGRAP